MSSSKHLHTGRAAAQHLYCGDSWSWSRLHGRDKCVSACISGGKVCDLQTLNWLDSTDGRGTLSLNPREIKTGQSDRSSKLPNNQRGKMAPEKED